MVADSKLEVQVTLLRSESAKDAHWDIRKKSSLNLSKILETGNFMQQKRTERTSICAKILLFGLQEDIDTQKFEYKLKHAWFCHARLCPICQHRKALVWRERAKEGCEKMLQENENLCFLHLVVTMRNCHVNELNNTLVHASESFDRMTKRLRKRGVILGFMRGTEVTREMDYCSECGKDSRKRRTCKYAHEHIYNDNCHPHIHVLLAVDKSYFHRGYIPLAEWRQIWKESLQVDYDPVVDIRRVGSPKKDADIKQPLLSAVVEVAKYCVKVDDEFLDSVTRTPEGERFFLKLDEELKGVRSIGLGGVFRKYMKASDPTDDEMTVTKEENENTLPTIVKQYREYVFQNKESAYVLRRVLTNDEASEIEIADEKRLLKKEKKAHKKVTE